MTARDEINWFVSFRIEHQDEVDRVAEFLGTDPASAMIAIMKAGIGSFEGLMALDAEMSERVQ